MDVLCSCFDCIQKHFPVEIYLPLQIVSHWTSNCRFSMWKRNWFSHFSICPRTAAPHLCVMDDSWRIVTQNQQSYFAELFIGARKFWIFCLITVPIVSFRNKVLIECARNGSPLSHVESIYLTFIQRFFFFFNSKKFIGRKNDVQQLSESNIWPRTRSP